MKNRQIHHSTNVSLQKYFLCSSICLLLIPLVSFAQQTLESPETQTTTPSSAQVSPEQVTKALGVLYQVVGNVINDVNSKDLVSVHNEDMMLYSAITTLLSDSGSAPGDQKEKKTNALTDFSRKVANLHEAADENNQTEADVRLKLVLEAFEQLKAFYDRAQLSKAEELAGQYTCPMHPDVIGKSTDLCPKCGMPLDQQLRINMFGSGQMIAAPATMKASIQTTGPLVPGQEVQCFLRVRKIDGSPVLPSDLMEVHTQKIHLLMIDDSLEDYHHIHPEPTDTPGSYSFSFTPMKAVSYRAWADVRSKLTGFQEYLMTEIPVISETKPTVKKDLSLQSQADGFHFRLSFDAKEIKAGQPVLCKLRITTTNGKPFSQLEPLMAAFAHIAGFNEDHTTVLHMHPRGAPVLNQTDRGGPDLEFMLYAIKPGFYRLFAQIQAGGVSKFASFGVMVSP